MMQHSPLIFLGNMLT